MSTALRHPGDTLAVLELALLEARTPVLLCPDNAQGLLAGCRAGLEAAGALARGAALFLYMATEALSLRHFEQSRSGDHSPGEAKDRHGGYVEAYLDDDTITYSRHPNCAS